MRILLKILTVLLLIVLGIMALMMIPSPQAPAPKPWEITMQADGNPQVLGIHLGKTTYGQLVERWREVGEPGIFREPSASAQSTVEVFFPRVNLGGLSARAVINLQIDQPTIDTMISRGYGGQLQQSGARLYEPAVDDRPTLLKAPVYAITYIPSIGLDERMLQSRLGPPPETQTLEKGKSLWTYPERGLSIELSDDGKAVFQYQALATEGSAR